MKGAIIVFSGTDGAGKSTQIERLCRQLAADRRRPRRLWSRGGYTPGMSGLKSCLRRLSGRTLLPAPGPGARRERTLSRPLVRRIWLGLAILDLILLYGVWLRYQRCWGRTVVCDRYLPDTQLDFQIHFPQENVQQWLLWRLLVWCTPRPDHQFLLIVPVEESQRRSLQKDEPFPDTPEVLAVRYAAYRSWEDDPRWHVLDGCQPADQLAVEIAGAVRGETVAAMVSS